MLHLQRALVLLEQNNYKEAEKELMRTLAEEPKHPLALRLLAMIYIDTGRPEEGVEAAQDALEADPSDGEAHYVLAYGLMRQHKDAEAEKRVQEAIRLNPHASHYFALWSATAMHRKQYKRAVELANQALALNAENMQALNLRATAQRYLGDNAGAEETIYRALEREPENSHSHANLGWSMLDQGKPKNALEHFREALRHNPQSQYAKSGLVEALKARYWVYRIFLAYYLWMEKQSGRIQFLVIFGVLFVNRIINRAMDTYPEAKPVLMPLFVLVVAFAFSTWVISPLFNLMLLVNPYGRFALSKEERFSAKLTGISLGTGLTAGALFLWVFPHGGFFALAFYGLFMMIPIAVLSWSREEKRLRWLTALAAVLAGIGAMAVLISFSVNAAFNWFSGAFIIGLLAFQLVTNFVAIRR